MILFNHFILVTFNLIILVTWRFISSKLNQMISPKSLLICYVFMYKFTFSFLNKPYVFCRSSLIIPKNNPTTHGRFVPRDAQLSLYYLLLQLASISHTIQDDWGQETPLQMLEILKSCKARNNKYKTIKTHNHTNDCESSNSRAYIKQ